MFAYQWSLGSRLGAGFAAVLGLVLLMAVLSLVQLKSLDEVQIHLNTRAEEAELAQQWSGQIQVNLARTLALAKADGAPHLKAYLDPQIKATSARITELQKTLDQSLTEPADRQPFEAIKEARSRYVAARDQVFATLGQEGSDAQVEQTLIPAAQRYLDSMVVLDRHLQAAAQQEATGARAKATSTRWLLMGIAGLALLLGGVLSWLLTRSITQPMHGVIASAEAIASGDLSGDIPVTRHDEIGRLQQAMYTMRGELNAMVTGIRQSTDGISTASGEVATGSQDLSQRTEQTAAHLQQAASTMSHLTTTVRQTADSARTANQMAATATESAEHGGQVVGEVVNNMQGILAASRRIGDIIGVIDGIAFQTNILALNAAVEAARAGEQGRGFAVVASEVRSLAQRSAAAAREIKSLIGESVERVESGAHLVDRAGSSMTDIVSHVKRVTDVIAEISAAAHEQSGGIAQVNGAVTELDQMTQQNAALVEESAAAAESLKDQAQRLAEVVSRFRLHA